MEEQIGTTNIPRPGAMPPFMRLRRSETAQLPLVATPSVRNSGVDLHAVSRPARAFTGDFYFTHRAGDRLWVALGDVAGKGLPAAIVMAMIQEELEARVAGCALTRCDPSTTAFRLHSFLRPLLPSNRFATMVIGHLSDDGVLELVNAGHCPPLVVRKDGTVERIGSTGPVIGILPTARWSSTTVRLEPGDAVLLYSDGLLEATAPNGTEFGIERIESAFRQSSGDARSRVASIVTAVDRFAKQPLGDDLTIAVIRY